MRRRKEPARKRATRIILNIMLGVTALLVVSAVVSCTRDDTSVFGYKPFIIRSESMAPTYLKYGIVLIKNGGYDDVKAGESIAFEAATFGGQPAFHRVAEVTPEGFVTKGDGNYIADKQIVTRDTFIGRAVWHTNITALVIPSLQAPRSAFTLIGLSILLVIVIAVFAKTLVKSRKTCEEEGT